MLIPTNIGRFIDIRKLGHGSQSVVYLATDPNLKRDVAIKMLRTYLLSPISKEHLLLREAQTVSKLQHPNIIPLYEIGEHNGFPYLVFEYVEGVSLRDQIYKNGPFDVYHAVAIMIQILLGIGCAHEQGVIHRDLSPSNILIDKNGIPRVMDFGLSIMVGIKGTIEKDISGTPLYMSPEHFSGTSLGPKSDIFSLGLIFYEMLVGQPAIDAENYISVMYKIAHESVTPPSLKNKIIDKNLDEIILKAVEKNQDLRYANTSQIIQDLIFYLDVYPSSEVEKLESAKIYSKISKYLVDIDQKASASKANYTYASELANKILKDYSLIWTGKSIGKRFAAIAIEKGFITKEQFIEAMVVQIENDLKGMEHTLLGSILYRMGYMNLEEINEVTESLPKGLINECPDCGILIFDCPHCGANLRRP